MACLHSHCCCLPTVHTHNTPAKKSTTMVPTTVRMMGTGLPSCSCSSSRGVALSSAMLLSACVCLSRGGCCAVSLGLAAKQQGRTGRSRLRGQSVGWERVCAG
jgi:hypothetical protein